jgi:anti-sigma factor RsiW
MRTHPLEEWIEIHRRRPLRPGEREQLESLLALDPALRGQWEQEVALTRFLHNLPDAPVPSNFNAAVWAAVTRQPAAVGWSGPGFLGWLGWPRPGLRLAAAVGAVALLIGGFGHQQYQSFQRSRIAASLTEISRGVEVASAVAQLPPTEVLQDFEAIYSLSHVRSLADEELLAALQ